MGSQRGKASEIVKIIERFEKRIFFFVTWSQSKTHGKIRVNYENIQDFTVLSHSHANNSLQYIQNK